ncbi:MAG: metalloregulator ArsR/SmtB family transcription factor [Bifidobacteriaceae bacterium]|jgi:DNA-binding transcriptional ArsR family regulator|nr:metalloregulator ArsR/SmtB family transcription factor [Bifidobacteriaceae bacterium]
MGEDNKGCIFGPENQYPDLAAEVFSLLSDATRVRIILALCEGEKPVGELAEQVGKSPTVVSQHLAKLRWGKIVQARQQGVRVYYSLIDDHARELVNHAVFQAEHVVHRVPPHHLKADGRTAGLETAEGSVSL